MPQQWPMRHPAIMVVDVARFTDPVRTLTHQRAVHEGLYSVLHGAFAEAGVDLDTCTVEDRGDGALILVPPQVDKSRLADQLPSRLIAGLRRHNAVHSAEASIQLRVALHVGEVYQDRYGAVSQAVNLAFRLLEAPDARSALRSSTGVLALIASDDFYRTVIVHDPAADPGSYWRIPVSVGDTSTVAWLRLPDDVAMGKLNIGRPLPHTATLSVAYTTAKLVLVGESGVGKTGLGWRLAHSEFVEHTSTHGQQFWVLDELGGTTADGIERDAILWDLAGQPDYRLIHALSLDDADLALVLFDPTPGDDPVRGVEYWLRQLGPDRPIILVAARSDRGAPRLTTQEIEAFCAERGIAGYVATSALQGDGLDELVERMRAAIRWDERPTTVTTQTFKHIKDYVLELKEATRAEETILSPTELRARLEQKHPGTQFTDEELLTAVRHLSNHGYVAQLSTSRGESRILLTPVLLNNLAASMVLEARRNPKGLGSLVVRELLADGANYAFCARCGQRVALPPADTPIELTQQLDGDGDRAAQRREVSRRLSFEQVLFRLTTYVTQEGIPAPDCFISYAWGDDHHERWVEHELAKAGITVVLDRWENARIGASVPRFVERIAAADRVIASPEQSGGHAALPHQIRQRRADGCFRGGRGGRPHREADDRLRGAQGERAARAPGRDLGVCVPAAAARSGLRRLQAGCALFSGSICPDREPLSDLVP